jgi:hypothetical protein
VQPVIRQSYAEPAFRVLEAADLDGEDWQRFEATLKPNTVQMRRLGHYAVDTRRRVRANSSGYPSHEQTETIGTDAACGGSVEQCDE